MISVPEKLADLAGDDQAKAFNARYQLLEAAYQSTKPGNQAEQSALAEALAAELTAKVPVETKADEKKKKDAPEEPETERGFVIAAKKDFAITWKPASFGCTKSWAP